MTQEKTIRGDLLQLAFRYIEKSCANFFTNPLGDDLPDVAWKALNVDIEHRYGDVHWYAQLVLRAPARTALEYTMDKDARKEAHFIIADVSEFAVAVTSGSELVNGLSDDDKDRLAEGLGRFLALVACGEISEEMLRHP